jgi:uncharacterized RDD family membrane protein YckC
MNNPDYLISTPENVDLHLELAGLGNRIMAGLVDRVLIGAMTLLIVAVCVGAAIAIEGSPMPTDTKTQTYYYLIGIGLLIVFIINFGYFIFFEGTWQGQTPGKRIAQIRVIEANGQPVGWSSVFIRNLLRIVDELPGIYLGILPMLIDKNERRFGDLAAGTLVIRERLQSLSTTALQIVGGADAELLFDTGQISPDDYALLVTYLKRRENISPIERKALASELASHFRGKLDVPRAEGESEETFIEKLYIAYNKRAELA